MYDVHYLELTSFTTIIWPLLISCSIHHFKMVIDFILPIHVVAFSYTYHSIIRITVNIATKFLLVKNSG